MYIYIPSEIKKYLLIPYRYLQKIHYSQYISSTTVQYSCPENKLKKKLLTVHCPTFGNSEKN